MRLSMKRKRRKIQVEFQELEKELKMRWLVMLKMFLDTTRFQRNNKTW